MAIGRHCPEAEEFGSEIKPQFMQSLGRQQDVRTPQVVDEKAQAIEILDESDASGIRDTGMETANEVIVVLDGEAEQPMELYCSNCEEATGFKILKQVLRPWCTPGPFAAPALLCPCLAPVGSLSPLSFSSCWQ